MKLKQVTVLLAIIAAISMAGCITPETEEPAGDLSVSKLLEEPVYETELSIYGRVSLLGELFCPCFELTSEGETVHVWYGLMVEDDGTERPAVSVEGIENGDWVVVTGELKAAGTHRSQNDFWASSIEKYEHSGEDQAREIATNYVMNMDEYRIYNGRNLAVTNVSPVRCPGCWQIELEFYLTSEKDPERTDKATVKLTLDNWEVVDVLYAQGGVPTEKLTFEEALAIAQSSECVKEGKLTENYVYNEYTSTWWIDLAPYTEQEGCNPACVVYEETKTAEINWRCTGVLQ